MGQDFLDIQYGTYTQIQIMINNCTYISSITDRVSNDSIRDARVKKNNVRYNFMSSGNITILFPLQALMKKKE